MKGKYLTHGTHKETETNQFELRKCQKDCLQNLLPLEVGNCRSVIKSTRGDGCELVNERSDDENVTVDNSTDHQYFDRPSWYLGMCKRQY